MPDAADRLPGLFAGPAAYRTGFEEGLLRMLGEPVLGAFILVLANAGFDPALQRRLGSDLRLRFADWQARFDRDDPHAVDAAPDDRAVFDDLRRCGIDALGQTRWRQVGDWWLQFNPLRGLRPPRTSHAPIDTLRRPFDAAAFHFDKPFLRPEVFWEGDWSGYALRLLLNKFPFATGHALLVPEPAAGLPQWLEPAWHGLVWELARQAGRSLPGIGFGYNAHGAYASVNHLHFQQFVEPDRLYPIESARWRHNGGDEDYPLAVRRIDDRDEAWAAVDSMQSANLGFNLLYRPGRLYLTPRPLQGQYRHSAWTGGFAWSEIAGVLTVSDEAAFDALDEAALLAEYRRLTRPALD
jgi:hypothetical protein